ncbi:MAG TPA: hypothetical protein VGU61_07790 [Noviherbaspirillum sp.]|jgi:hypothetical protein|uniref:hypothetical protein n=1 Tax=Noviherbaspirillum sp. TaxID=1926288 RepID=UPI002DDCAE80|nr:hypothetical protein [Noviherbaspirillum sp.]HEV2610154.1 hypothetical protein [Noviherbaspirillum sp.]
MYFLYLSDTGHQMKSSKPQTTDRVSARGWLFYACLNVGSAVEQPGVGESIPDSSFPARHFILAGMQYTATPKTIPAKVSDSLPDRFRTRMAKDKTTLSG